MSCEGPLTVDSKSRVRQETFNTLNVLKEQVYQEIPQASLDGSLEIKVMLVVPRAEFEIKQE